MSSKRPRAASCPRNGRGGGEHGPRRRGRQRQCGSHQHRRHRRRIVVLFSGCSRRCRFRVAAAAPTGRPGRRRRDSDGKTSRDSVLSGPRAWARPRLVKDSGRPARGRSCQARPGGPTRRRFRGRRAGPRASGRAAGCSFRPRGRRPDQPPGTEPRRCRDLPRRPGERWPRLELRDRPGPRSKKLGPASVAEVLMPISEVHRRLPAEVVGGRDATTPRCRTAHSTHAVGGRKQQAAVRDKRRRIALGAVFSPGRVVRPAPVVSWRFDRLDTQRSSRPWDSGRVEEK